MVDHERCRGCNRIFIADYLIPTNDSFMVLCSDCIVNQDEIVTRIKKEEELKDKTKEN